MPADPWAGSGPWPLDCGSFAIPAGHPCLEGHFPGNPVVPGVVLLDHALALLEEAFPGRRLAGPSSVRFRRPVLPGQTILVQARPGRDGALGFTGLCEDAVMLSGSLGLSAT